MTSRKPDTDAAGELDRPPVERDDITIAVPPGWRQTSDHDHGIVMAASAAVASRSGFVPRVVLDAEPVDGSFESWQARALTVLGDLLEGFDQEDTDDYHLGTEPVRYRRVSFASNDHELVSEQWCWLIGGVGFTLTGTVAREDYADYTDLFEDVAGTFSVRRPRRVDDAR